MAIYHFSEKNISRSDGRSAVACAAYRSGQKLQDQVYGKTQDYTKKEGVEYSRIYAPDRTDEKLLDREILWNSVEQAEFKKNGEIKLSARLAKEYEAALPHELSIDQQKDLIDDFCQKIVEKHSVIIDASIHAPHDNNLNCHAHIMFTTRKVNQQGLLGAKAREFNDQGPQLLKEWRETFAEVTNHHLAEAGLDVRIDHRSYKDQGRDYLEPTVHEGNEITVLRREGVDTEISLKNDATLAKTQELVELEQIIKGLNQEIKLLRTNDYSSLLKDLEQQLQQTETEEREILAELSKLEELEREQKENELSGKIDKAYEDFIEQQSQYALFANHFYELGTAHDRQSDKLDKSLTRSDNWANKQVGVYRHYDGLFYSEYDHRPVNLKTPDFYISPHEFRKHQDKLHQKYLESVAQLADQLNIEKLISDMHENAKILQDNDIELPIPAPSLLQKVTRTFVHSFNNLHNFDDHMKPVIDEHRELIETQKLEQAERYEQSRFKEKLLEAENQERYRLAEEQRNTARLHAEQRLANEMRWTKEPSSPKKQDTDKNNNFQP